MNRQMLSHYGWIIIITLVITVMIAFATPFGDYVGTGLLNASGGFVDVSKKALSDENMANKEQKWEDKIAEMQTGFAQHNTDVPEGGTYYSDVTSTSGGTGGQPQANAILAKGDKFPTPKEGDIYVYGDYTYRYGYKKGTYPGSWSKNTDLNGWGLQVNTTKETYELPLGTIAGKPIVNADYLFQDNTNLKVAPQLPDTITSLSNTFSGCTSLTTCSSLPENALYLSSTFYGCSSLTTAPEIPANVKTMGGTFWNCTSLTTAPAIPNSVTYMGQTFDGCTNLKIAPSIPDGVQNLSNTFRKCTSLITAPTIPSSVTNLSQTFYGCTNLAGTIEINATSTYLDYNQCFYNTTKPITLTGTSPKRSELANTANNHNVTVK